MTMRKVGGKFNYSARLQNFARLHLEKWDRFAVYLSHFSRSCGKKNRATSPEIGTVPRARGLVCLKSANSTFEIEDGSTIFDCQPTITPMSWNESLNCKDKYFNSNRLLQFFIL